jgi:hypothetical protein
MVYDKKRRRTLSKTISCLLNAKKQLIIPNRALSNQDLFRYVSCLKIPFFRGVFMKDALPSVMWKNESGIVNLDNSNGPGTHWVCYKKLGSTVYYFDSFGNLPPPKELQKYFRSAKQVLYNYDRQQPDDTSICGHLCLEFLAKSVSQL